MKLSRATSSLDGLEALQASVYLQKTTHIYHGIVFRIAFYNALQGTEY